MRDTSAAGRASSLEHDPADALRKPSRAQSQWLKRLAGSARPPAAGRCRAARGRRAAGDPGLAAGQRAGCRHRAAGAALGPAGRHPRHRRADAGPRLYRLGRRTRRRHRRRADQAPGAPGPVRAPGGQGAALEPGPGLGRAGQRRGGPGRGAGWLLRQIPAGHGRRRHAAGGIFRVAVSGGCDRGPGAADHRAADSLVHGPGRLGAQGASRRHLRAFARLSGFFADRLRGLSTLKLYGRAEAEAESVAAASDALRQRTLSVLRIAFLSSAVLEFFAALGVAGWPCTSG